MSWSCRRPGCNREAAVCISYDTVACQVWMDPIALGPAGGQSLCEQHASRLSAPRGWVVVDRRESQSNLVTSGGAQTSEPLSSQPDSPTSASEAAPTPRVRRPLSRGWGQFDAPTLDFVADGSAVAPADEADPSEYATEAVAIAAAATEVSAESPATSGSVEAEAAVPPATPPAAVRVPAAPTVTVEMGRPKGRLLSRAFESVGMQRSAITDSLTRVTSSAPEDPTPEGSLPE